MNLRLAISIATALAASSLDAAPAAAQPAPIPELLYPRNGDAIANPQASFVWEAVPASNALYTVEVSDGPAFSAIVRRGIDLSFTSFTLLPSGVLQRGQTYWWRVRTSVPGRSPSTSPASFFQVRPKDTSYRFELSRNFTFASTDAVHTIASTSLTLGASEAIAENTAYYWRVTASDAAGNLVQSDVSRFTVSDRFAPIAPAPVYPPIGAALINPSVTFDWTDAQDPAPVTYRITVSTTTSLANPAIERAGLRDSKFAAAMPLARGAIYYWRVVATDQLGNRTTGPIWPFRIQPRPIAYRFELSQDPSFTTRAVDRRTLDDASYALSAAEAVQEDRDYHWRVTATDVAGNERRSDVSRFRMLDTFAPIPPALLYPPSGETVINPRVTFDWSDAIDPGGLSPYALEVARDEAFSDLVFDERGLVVSHYTAVSALESGRTYHWRVRASDQSGNTFVTPASSLSIAPKLTYRLEIARDAAFADMAYTISGLTETSHTLPRRDRIEPGRSYHWRVAALDGVGQESVAGPQTFQTNVPRLSTEEIRVFPQPERATFSFATDAALDWVVELREMRNSACGRLVYRNTYDATRTAGGSWLGLSPGAEYCWSAVGVGQGGGGGALDDTGTFTLPALPAFTEAAAFTPSGGAIEVSAEVSAPGDGEVAYDDGPCAASPTALVFDGSTSASFPGRVIGGDRFGVEAWIKPAAADGTGDVFSAGGGNLRLALRGGRLRLVMNTTNGVADVETAALVAPDRWTHVGASFADSAIRLYIDGRIRRGVPWRAYLLEGQPAMRLGGAAGAGFSGAVAGVALYDRGLSVEQMMAHQALGPAAEIPAERHRAAAWSFDEAPGVQSIYDASGNHVAGFLGAREAADAADPSRSPASIERAPMGTGTTLSATLSSLTAGEKCGRVIVTTQLGAIASQPPTTFEKPRDVTPPAILLASRNVSEECTGAGQRPLSLIAPDVTDDIDPRPSVAPHLGAANGPAIAFPYTFPLGTTEVWWVARDASGNTRTAVQAIRIRDTLPPTLVAGPPLTVEATSAAGTQVAAQLSSAADTCTAALTTRDDAPALFAVGDTIVRFEVEDGSGNVAASDRVVRVIDTSPPSFSPRLQPINVGHDGSSCFDFLPPRPSVSDAGYLAAAVTASWTRLSGPGLPSCWDIGSHVLRWTIRDPSGNQATGSQTILVQQAVLSILSRGLEAPPVPNPSPGRYYANPVTVVFEVRDGVAPYTVAVFPVPAALTNAGNVYRARYDEDGAYPDILILAQDSNAGGVTFGASRLSGFGIDRRAPALDAGIDQTGVVVSDPSTYPTYLPGELVSLERIRANDGPVELVSLGSALRFDGGDLAQAVHSSSLTSTGALALEAWVRVPRLADGVLISKGGSYALSVSRSGQAELSLQLPGAHASARGGRIRPGVWHHLAGTFDGRRARLYLDAEPAADAWASGAIQSGTGPLAIGAELNGNAVSRGLDGDLAGVALWRRSLSQGELRSRFRGGFGRRPSPDASSIALYDFAGTGPRAIDLSAEQNHAQLGRVAAETPARLPLIHPANPGASGVVRMQVRLFNGAGSRVSQMIDTSTAASGNPLPVGPRAIGGRTCGAPTGAVCRSGDTELSSEGITQWNLNATGAVRMEINATDAAGNQSAQNIYFRTDDYAGVLSRSASNLDAQIRSPDNLALQEYEDARALLAMAQSYALGVRPHLDGSYLRAEQAADVLLSAEARGRPAGNVPERLARAIAGNAGGSLARLAPQVAPEDRLFFDPALFLLEDARFARARGAFVEQSAFAREALDAVVLLLPEHEPMRGSMQDARVRLESTLDRLALGQLTLSGVRTDSPRQIEVLRLISGARDSLRDVLDREVGVAQSSVRTPFSSDLFAIRTRLATDVIGPASCMSVLATLQYGDDRFASCWISLSQVAQILDTLTESQIHTYRWRTLVGLAQLGLLDVLLYHGDKSLLWVASNTPSTQSLELVLPDDLAPRVPAATPVSAVDQSDGLLASAYAVHAAVRGMFARGDVNGAWVLLLDERCLVVRLYNRYYSSNRSIATVADPKEPPIDPTAAGCPP